MGDEQRISIASGGYDGMHTALRLGTAAVP
jgi:hypothetical protein